MSELTRSQKLINFYDKKRKIIFYTKIIPLLRIGYTITQIYKILKKDEGTIRLYVRKYGTVYDKQNALQNDRRNHKVAITRKFNQKIEQNYSKIVTYIDQGYTNNEIAKLIGYDRNFIERALKYKNNFEYVTKIRNNGLKRKKEGNKKRLANPNYRDVFVIAGLQRRIQSLENNKKYYPFILACLKRNNSIQDIKNILDSKNINLYYCAIKNLIKHYGGRSALQRAKINGYIQSNKAIFCDNNIICKKRTSKDEIKLKNIIKEYIPHAVWQHEIKLNNKIYYIDIADIQNKIAFEYDGWYWHKDKIFRDQKRDKELLDEGWQTIRFVFKGSPSIKKLKETFLNRIKELDLLHILT